MVNTHFLSIKLSCRGKDLLNCTQTLRCSCLSQSVQSECYELEVRRTIVWFPVGGKGFSSSRNCWLRPWGPPSLPFCGYCGLFCPEEKWLGTLKLTACFHLIAEFMNEWTYTSTTIMNGARCGVVVKALRYKPAGRGFDSRLCYWNFSVA